MSKPILKMRALIQIMPTTDANPMTIDNKICHSITGSVDEVTRRIMTNGMSGGVKLVTIASMPFGFSAMGNQSINGMNNIIMTGPSSA